MMLTREPVAFFCYFSSFELMTRGKKVWADDWRWCWCWWHEGNFLFINLWGGLGRSPGVSMRGLLISQLHFCLSYKCFSCCTSWHIDAGQALAGFPGWWSCRYIFLGDHLSSGIPPILSIHRMIRSIWNGLIPVRFSTSDLMLCSLGWGVWLGWSWQNCWCYPAFVSWYLTTPEQTFYRPPGCCRKQTNIVVFNHPSIRVNRANTCPSTRMWSRVVCKETGGEKPPDIGVLGTASKYPLKGISKVIWGT